MTYNFGTLKGITQFLKATENKDGDLAELIKNLALTSGAFVAVISGVGIPAALPPCRLQA